MAIHQEPSTDPMLDTTVILDLRRTPRDPKGPKSSASEQSRSPRPAGEDVVANETAKEERDEEFQPSQEHDYWRAHYRTRPYVDQACPAYERYAPAYEFGWDSFFRYGRTADGLETEFTEMEPKLGRDWRSTHGPDALAWRYAQPAARDAWERMRESQRV